MFRNIFFVSSVIGLFAATAHGEEVEWIESLVLSNNGSQIVSYVSPVGGLIVTSVDTVDRRVAREAADRQIEIDYAIENGLPVPIPDDFVVIMNGSNAVIDAVESVDEVDPLLTREGYSDPLLNVDVPQFNQPLITSNKTVTANTRRVSVNGGERNKLVVSRNSDGSLVGSHSVKTPPIERLSGLHSPLTASTLDYMGGKSSSNNGLPKVGSLTTVSPRTIQDYDPFKTMVKWDWNAISVGEGVRRLASFVGYNLVVRDEFAKVVYTMPLPGSHQVVSGIDTQTALELLGGPAFTLLLNHSNRTVQHVVKTDYLVGDVSTLPLCPSNVEFAIQGGNAWIMDGGVKCVYRGMLEQ